MTERAYIVLVIDTTVWPREVIGAGIFSEPGPTVGAGRITIELDSFEGESFAAAKQAAERELSSQLYSWIGRLEIDPVRGALRDGRKRA